MIIISYHDINVKFGIVRTSINKRATRSQKEGFVLITSIRSLQ